MLLLLLLLMLLLLEHLAGHDHCVQMFRFAHGHDGILVSLLKLLLLLVQSRGARSARVWLGFDARLIGRRARVVAAVTVNGTRRWGTRHTRLNGR